MPSEWDERKRRANLAKHRIDFAALDQMFEADLLEEDDTRRDYGERRIKAIGEANGVIVSVVYTWRGKRRRLISARRREQMSARSTKRSSPQVEPRDLTDWERVRSMTEEEIEAGAASDPDNPSWTEDDFRRARVVRAGSAEKPVIWVHVDEDVRQWVHERRGDTDQLINDLLRTAMQKERESQGS